MQPAIASAYLAPGTFVRNLSYATDVTLSTLWNPRIKAQRSIKLGRLYTTHPHDYVSPRRQLNKLAIDT
jgi:hypothetical protein